MNKRYRVMKSVTVEFSTAVYRCLFFTVRCFSLLNIVDICSTCDLVVNCNICCVSRWYKPFSMSAGYRNKNKTSHLICWGDSVCPDGIRLQQLKFNPSFALVPYRRHLYWRLAKACSCRPIRLQTNRSLIRVTCDAISVSFQKHESCPR